MNLSYIIKGKGIDFMLDTLPFKLKKILIMGLLASAWSSAAQAEIVLPDFSSASESALSTSEESRIGRQIVAQIRAANGIVVDAEINAYIQSLGARLLKASGRSPFQYYFFMVEDGTINAFALPGGVIGMNAGLMLFASTESEMASVLGHEIAHVTQRHLARKQELQSRNQWLSIAAMIMAGIAASKTKTPGLVVAGAGAGATAELAYSRDFEREADRIGMQIMAKAQFDVQDMSRFFQTLGQQSRYNKDTPFAFLLTHPLTPERVAEAQNRALNYPAVGAPSSLDFLLSKAKLGVLAADTPISAVLQYQAMDEPSDKLAAGVFFYGYAYAQLAAGNPVEATTLMAKAQAKLPKTRFLTTLAAEIEQASGRGDKALSIYQTALNSAPKDRPLILSEIRQLLMNQQKTLASQRLETLLSLSPNDPDFLRLQAQSYADVDAFRSHAAEGNALFLEGSYESAIVQYKLATAAPSTDNRLRATIEARLKQAEQAMAAQKNNG
jgi:predicted Zn-dependent protease